MKKRLLSIMMTVVIMLSCSGVTSAQLNRQSDIFNNESVASDLLLHLGVVKNDISSKYENFVTRGEFANMLVKVVFRDGVLGKGEVIFDDIAVDSVYSDSVNTLTHLNVISRGSSFRPNDTILSKEALKMIVCALGYKMIAERKGGYPSGYESVALETGLTRNVQYEEKLTYSAAVCLLYSMLNLKIGELNITSEGYYYTAGNKTYAEEYLKLMRTEGVVTATEITSISSGNGTSENCIQIDNEDFYTEEDLTSLLGQYVEVYYELDSYSDKKLISALPDSKRNKTVIIRGKDINSFNDMSYSYRDEYANGKNRNVYLEKSAYIIYNGEAIDSRSFVINETTMIPKTGEVRLLDNNNNGKYDIVFISNYRKFMVSNYNAEDKVLYGYNGEKPIELEDKDYTVYAADGKKVALELATVEKTVLMIGESSDGEYIDIVICSEVIEGSVTSISQDGDGAYLYEINGGIYRTSAEFKEKLLLGEKGIFYLNIYEEIEFYDSVAPSGGKFAYLIDYRNKNGLGRTKLVDIFTEDGVIKTLCLADKIKIDGRRYRTGDEKIEEILENAKNGLIVFNENVHEEITLIDTPQSDLDLEYGLQYFPNGKNVKSYIEPYTTTFPNIGVTTSATKIFAVPQDGDEEQFRVGSPTLLTGYTGGQSVTMSVSIYRFGNETIRVAAAVATVRDTGYSIENEYLASSAGVQLVVDKRRGFNAQGDECWKIVTKKGSNENTYYTTDVDSLTIERDGQEYEISEGDIIICGTDKYGNINKGNVRLIYDADEEFFDTSVTPRYTTSYSSEFNVKQVWCYKRTDQKGFAWVSMKPPVENMSYPDLYLYNLDDFSEVYIYDTEEETVTKGSFGDMIFYSEAGNGCSKIIFYKRYLNSAGWCVIYR